MSQFRNPFEFDAAANLPLDMIEEVYIEDHNCSRFIFSNRNIFLLGERGSGKSMMLIYHSLRLTLLKSKKEETPSNFDYVGIHIPCKRPLFNKPEYLLISDRSLASSISEHYLVLAVLYAIADELGASEDIVSELNHIDCISDFEYLIGAELPKKNNFFDAIKMFSQRQINKVENYPGSLVNLFNEIPLYSFQSVILPVLNLVKTCDLLKKSHFILMIDDAHDLNDFQIRKINSWVSYRDHSLFSIKIATADVYKHSLETEFGSYIVEGHDFTSINMEKNLQNSTSPFYKLAKDIIERRLNLVNLTDVSAEDYFPANKSLQEDLRKCEESVRAQALLEYPDAPKKKISDYIYKKKRVEYFRNRAHKANKPPYSGFDILIHASTGVIRNLLSPCYEMFDQAYSEANGKKIEFIAPKIQESVLMETSEKMWTNLRAKKLSDQLTDCTEEQAIWIHNFFETLGDLFTKRLKVHNSEPRVLTFTISGNSEEYSKIIEPVFNIARKALLLYERSGPAKDSGRRETVYVPNRMLWIARGLDPVGQHGRVSIPAKDIVAAFKGSSFPYVADDCIEDSQQEIQF